MVMLPSTWWNPSSDRRVAGCLIQQRHSGDKSDKKGNRYKQQAALIFRSEVIFIFSCKWTSSTWDIISCQEDPIMIHRNIKGVTSGPTKEWWKFLAWVFCVFAGNLVSPKSAEKTVCPLINVYITMAAHHVQWKKRKITTISMTIFHSDVNLPKGNPFVFQLIHDQFPGKTTKITGPSCARPRAKTGRRHLSSRGSGTSRM